MTSHAPISVYAILIMLSLCATACSSDNGDASSGAPQDVTQGTETQQQITCVPCSGDFVIVAPEELEALRYCKSISGQLVLDGRNEVATVLSELAIRHYIPSP